MEGVLERCLARLPVMYRPFLRMCNIDLGAGTCVVYAPDSVTLTRVSSQRVLAVLCEESGCENVKFELGNAEPLPKPHTPLPCERPLHVGKREKYKAIETVYDGYRFRSRLEARWAVFFHEAGIQYQYEPEGFQGCNGAYLPDFYFPEYKVYAEVKGTDEALEKDAAKIAGAICDWTVPISDGLLILGEIPNYEKIVPGNIPIFSFLHYHNGDECSMAGGVSAQFAAFIHGKSDNDKLRLAIGNHDILASLFLYPEGVSLDGEIPECVSVKCLWSGFDLRSYNEKRFANLKRCYQKARQARFEHGENGK